MATRPCSANSSAHAASTAASTIGSTSGGQPGHDRVDGDLLDRRLAAVGRHDADDLLRVARGVLEHRHDALGRGRDDGQAVGQPALEAAPRTGPRARRSSMRARADAPVARAARRAARRAATSGSRVRLAQPGPHLGQAVEVELRARRRGELGQRARCRPSTRPRSSPPSSSSSAGTASGSKRSDSSSSVVELGDRAQPDAARLLRGLGGVGLREDPHRRAGRRRGVEHGQHLVAHGAVVLDQREQFGHARRL